MKLDSNCSQWLAAAAPPPGATQADQSRISTPAPTQIAKPEVYTSRTG
jgi:hypothetical protein